MAEIDDGAVSNKAVFVTPAILPDDTREVLGLWLQANEAAFPRPQIRTCIARPLRHPMSLASDKDRMGP